MEFLKTFILITDDDSNESDHRSGTLLITICLSSKPLNSSQLRSFNLLLFSKRKRQVLFKHWTFERVQTDLLFLGGNDHK